MKRKIWLSYDLGVSGDYEGSYAWLDHHEALECGESLAVLEYEYEGDLPTELLNDLKEHVKTETRTRIYIIYRGDEGRIRGRFIMGGRRRAPWVGHAIQEDDAEDAEDEEDEALYPGRYWVLVCPSHPEGSSS